MSTAKKAALDKLRARVEQARLAAQADTALLAQLSLEQLRGRAATHKLGTNVQGWVNPYAKDDPRHLLLEYQFHYFRDDSRFKIGCMSRQTGKDFTSEGEAVEDCMVRSKTEWLVAGPSERQALDSLDKGKEWAAAFDLAIADYQEERLGGAGTLLKAAELTFANGSRMRAVPGRPDTVRGRSANVLLTEFDFFDDPALTWRAILPSITNPLRGGEKKVRLVSTPNGKGRMMHKIMTKEDTGKMRWSRHLVTIYQAVLMGLPVDIAELREALDDPEGWAQEYECEFLDGSNVLLPYEIIALAESADATEFCDPQFYRHTRNPLFLGIDFGRQNDPTVCWTLEKIGDIFWTREVLPLRQMSTPDQEKALAERIRAATKVCFDYTGPGIGLGDYLVKQFHEWKPSEHKFGKIELCTFTPAFKRDIFPKLRRAFEGPTKIRVPISVDVREDLHAMKQIVRAGAYSYEAPRTAEGHSDRCTAAALAWRAGESENGPVRFSLIQPRTHARPDAFGVKHGWGKTSVL